MEGSTPTFGGAASSSALTKKKVFSSDICISNDIPVFATIKSEIRYKGFYNSTDTTEDEMMAAHWKVFKFFHKIPAKEQKDMQPYARCFADLALTVEL